VQVKGVISGFTSHFISKSVASVHGSDSLYCEIIPVVGQPIATNRRDCHETVCGLEPVFGNSIEVWHD
jgi:hypothetical protein